MCVCVYTQNDPEDLYTYIFKKHLIKCLEYNQLIFEVECIVGLSENHIEYIKHQLEVNTLQGRNKWSTAGLILGTHGVYLQQRA